MLIDLAEAALIGGDVDAKIDAVVKRYKDITIGLGLDHTMFEVIAEDLRERVEGDKSNNELFIDSLKASGEDNNAKLIAAYFNAAGIPAQYVSPKEGLVVNDLPERTYALPEAYENLSILKDTEEIIIFPGFFGYTKDGILRTFDRGGSDITGSILAAAVNADLYENFTDVDCVFSANPKVVNDQRKLKKLRIVKCVNYLMQVLPYSMMKR